MSRKNSKKCVCCLSLISAFVLFRYEGTFGDYDELIVQFGFVILFVVAFPAAPFLAMLNTFLEIWIDGTKLDTSCRRPMPKGAKDIGTWFSVLEFLSWMAILTNVGIIVFEIMTTKAEDAGNDFPLSEKLMIFLIMEHCLFAGKALLGFFIPDEVSLCFPLVRSLLVSLVFSQFTSSWLAMVFLLRFFSFFLFLAPGSS